MMNKKSQLSNIFTIFSVSIVFFLSWFILGAMELSSGFITELLQLGVSLAGGSDGVSVLVKLFVPAFFIFSMLGYILWIRGAMNEI
jgi:hypothetical protein